MNISIKNLFSKLFFFTTLISSFLLGLFYFNSTTGLDYNRYILNLMFFDNQNVEVLDSQGTFYYFIISKYILFFNSNQYTYEVLNESIQFINFLFYLIGLSGIYKILQKRNTNINDIFLTFSILNFLPTAFYFRLTMKPEALAFALLPWVLNFANRYFEKNNFKEMLKLSLSLSVLLTLKASITGMVILILLIYYRAELKNVTKHKVLLGVSSTVTIFLIYFIFIVTGRWLFARPHQNVEVLKDKWDNTAPLSFYYNIDFKNLLENPFKHLHSDSFISITFLDTFADYFTFFWNHREFGNYFAYNRIQFSENFLIQTFLPQYISIFLTFIFYVFVILFFIKNPNKHIDLTFPLVGICILVINSFGLPSTNFDPTTGDLFKVHYYSFLFSYSFVFLIIYIQSKNFTYKFLTLLLIPVFLLVMGFPKTPNQDFQIDQLNRIENSIFCNFFDVIHDISCNS